MFFSLNNEIMILEMIWKRSIQRKALYNHMFLGLTAKTCRTTRDALICSEKKICKERSGHAFVFQSY